MRQGAWLLLGMSHLLLVVSRPVITSMVGPGQTSPTITCHLPLTCWGNGRFPYAVNPAAIAYFLATMAWSTVW
jgi:hypothetical protein